MNPLSIAGLTLALMIATALVTSSITRARILRRHGQADERDARIRAMEADLGMPTTVPRKETVDFTPTNLQLTVDKGYMIPGDMITLRCGWPQCRYEITTQVSESVNLLDANNIPGGDQLIRHQADYAHWNANVHIREWA